MEALKETIVDIEYDDLDITKTRLVGSKQSIEIELTISISDRLDDKKHMFLYFTHEEIEQMLAAVIEHKLTNLITGG